MAQQWYEIRSKEEWPLFMSFQMKFRNDFNLKT